jgi:polyhydroxyalkanoate synthesis repressor PhaR
MTTKTLAIMIKKYANRRLYHTGTSSYVTLDDLSQMVHNAEDFIVTDAKSGEDITRSVLTQIIFDQENKVGQGEKLLPISFLRQLIRFYGDSMQALVPKYLEFSIDRLTSDQQKFRDHLKSSFGVPTLPTSILPNPILATPSFTAPASFKMIEDQARANMAMFTEALSLFSPFKAKKTEIVDTPVTNQSSDADDLNFVKQQLADLQIRLDKMDKKK